MNKTRSFICGIRGLKLSDKEILFLKKYRPWGVILFSRNIKTIEQTKSLTKKIKKIFNDKSYPILIDEEGGRVTRLKKFIENTRFNAEYFGKLYGQSKIKFNLYFETQINQISYLLNILGININTVPVLDLRRKNTHRIIGNRSYSKNPKIVSKIGNISISSYRKNSIATIIKHIPGHGLSNLDSHKKMPIVNKSLKYLIKNDFYTFKNKNSLFAMTAHIVFKKIDPINTVTHSKKMINIIRNKIGFKNLIISDDISMKALKYSIDFNTIKAFKAGCDIVMHCNGKMNEMIKVAENSPIINKFVIKKTSQFKDFLR